MRTGHVPAAVRSLIPIIPEELSRLCEELLHWDPTKRPTGREVRRRIAPGASPPPPPAPPFLGRDRHLRELADAFKSSQDSQPGRAVVVHLHGTSGMGKSALAAHFLQQVRKQHANAVLLRGRCYERESVPYKALAELVNALKRFWRRLSREKAALLVPDEVGPLVQVFPELRVEAIAEAATRGSPESPDPNEQRRRATAGLREVLRRIGKRWPLVICLDDLQWGDLDSAVMLTNLLAPPDPPRLLLLACYRSEDKDGPFLKNFSAPAATELPVERLSFEESRDLAVAVPGPEAAPLLTPENAKAVAEESGGNPFFVYMLVHAVLAGEPVLLDQVIWTRIRSLPEDQRHLLEIVAVAGRPLRTSVAFRAAELADGRRALIHLQHTRMLKGGLAEQQEIQTYHDRIRETVVARLTPETLRERHRRLAVALESSDRPDPEVLAEHLHRSGQLERAGKYYEEAADRAEKILAFDRAATLYRLALEVGRFDGEAKRRLQTSLGKSLANAGRGAEAGQAYLDAAIGAAPAQTLELQHLAGEQLMRAGQIEKGLEVLRFVLRSIGITLPETRRQVVWSLVWSNIKLWWRGTKFRERDAGQIPADELARIDLCWSIGSILALADTALGSALHRGYFIPLALAAGEPNRVALALGGLACADAITGGPNQQRGDALLRQARDLAERTGVPYTRAEVESMSSVCAILLGQWKEVDAFTRRAESLFRKECTGAAWEIGMSYHYRFAALFFRGEWKQLAQEIPPLLIDARARRDLYTATSLQIHSAHLDIADDEPDRCRETIVKAMRLWPQQGFHLQHYHAMLGEVEASLYAGKPAEAWTTTRERWPDLSESLLLRVQEIRVVMTHLRARSALAAAFALSPGGEQDKLVRSAERDARQLERERMGYANAMAQLIRATIAFHRGKRAEAVEILESGAAGLEKADMLLYLAAARWQLGKLLGGERGEALIQDAKAFITGQGIRNPVRILNIYTPGFPAAE
jgi:eukaryotic-like serine/threonine-protein kinase